VAVAVVDLLQAVDVEEQDRKRSLRPLRPLDLSIQHVHELAVVGQTGQGIAQRQMPQLLFHSPAFRDDGGEGQGHHRHDADERLQQEQRLVWRFLHEGAEAVQGAPDGDPGQHEDCRRGFTLSEAKRSPDEQGNADERQRLVPDLGREEPAEDDQSR